MTCFYRVQLDLEKLQILVFIFECVMLSMTYLVYLQLSDLGQLDLSLHGGRRYWGRSFSPPSALDLEGLCVLQL